MLEVILRRLQPIRIKSTEELISRQEEAQMNKLSTNIPNTKHHYNIYSLTLKNVR